MTSENIAEIPKGATLVATRDGVDMGIYLYDIGEGYGVLQNLDNGILRRINLGQYLAHGYWTIVGETDKQRNDDAIRRRSWDLPSDIDSLRNQLANNHGKSWQSPLPLVKFMHKSAALPMPTDLLVEVVNYLLDNNLEATLPTWAKEDYFSEVHKRTFKKRSGKPTRTVLTEG
jgi:hypothetical protein